jgi:hypothetical protein
MTAVAGSVFTAAQFNQYVRDNLNQTGPALVTATGQILVATGPNTLAARTPTSAIVTTSDTTTSSSYTNLGSTSGPAVTAVTGANALVHILANCTCSSSANAALMSFTVTGSSSISSADSRAVGSSQQQAGGLFLINALTPGSNTFTAVYRTGTGTGTFSQRGITVIPL